MPTEFYLGLVHAGGVLFSMLFMPDSTMSMLHPWAPMGTHGPPLGTPLGTMTHPG